MSEQFKLGEVAKLVVDELTIDIPALSANGQEVVVIGCQQEYRSTVNGVDAGLHYAYLVRTASGQTILAEPHELRKKQPPRSAKSIMREAILKAKQPVGVPA